MTKPKAKRPSVCKLILTVELEYDQSMMHENDPAARRWFYTEILGAKEGLYLHSNEIGDEVGKVKILSVVRSLNEVAHHD